MNLVKAQALAKDLQIQDLQRYADGFDPRIIPPWLATGEIQSKMDLNKRMQMMQGAVQGEQPSVKEQIEQKAGLMAAQAMQQQQAQQQMAGQMAQRPGPAPANVPQPEPQPEPQPSMMARGGLASVPVNFDFSGGGIVAFDDGGSSNKAETAEEREQREAAKKDSEGIKKALAFVAGLPAEALKTLVSAPGYGLSKNSAPAPAPAPAQRPPVSEAQATMKAGPQAAMPVGLPAALAQQKPVAKTQAPAQRPTQAAQPMQSARPETSPYFDEADKYLKEEIKAPTAQSIIAEQTALSPAAMQESAMQQRAADQRARANQEREAYNKSKPSGLDELIRMFGQAGQYKGMSGLAPAYTAIEQEKRANDLAAEKRYNDALTGIEGREYEGGKELFGARTGAMKDANKSYQDRLKSRTETYASLAGVDQRRMDEALNRLNNIQLQQMRMAQSAAEGTRPGEGERFAAKYLGLIAAGNPKDAEAYKDAYLLGKKGEPKEDTLAKAIAEAEVKIATSVMLPEMKAQQMAGLAALKRQQAGNTGGATVTVGGKTYTFPTQEAANKFKAEAGVK
jgi:hypothetical protein